MGFKPLPLPYIPPSRSWPRGARDATSGQAHGFGDGLAASYKGFGRSPDGYALPSMPRPRPDPRLKNVTLR